MATTTMASAITQSHAHPSFWFVEDRRWYKGGTHIMDDFGNLVRIGWSGFSIYCHGGA